MADAIGDAQPDPILEPITGVADDFRKTAGETALLVDELQLLQLAMNFSSHNELRAQGYHDVRGGNRDFQKHRLVAGRTNPQPTNRVGLQLVDHKPSVC